MSREYLGRVVRRVWTVWAAEQADCKPAWVAPWEELPEPQREVDRRIGQTLFALGVEDTLTVVREVLEEYRVRARRPLEAPRGRQRERSRAHAMLELLDAIELTLTTGEIAAEPAPSPSSPCAERRRPHHPSGISEASGRPAGDGAPAGPTEATPAQDVRHRLERDRAGGPS